MVQGDKMTEIRRLTSEDWPSFRRIQAISFNYAVNSSDKNHERDPLDHPDDWVWGAFENGKLVAGTYEIDFLMRFDGHSAKMTGIGGVATLPESRGGGYMRRIFEKLLPESYENGFIFSNLSPFSHDFYRKFGYETACARNNITINTKKLLSIKPYGEFINVMPSGDSSSEIMQELAKIHSTYIGNINHAIQRDYWPDNRAWKRFIKEEPWARGTFLYLWKDENGIPRSYMKYRIVSDDGDQNVQVTELAFIDKKGLYGCLGLIGGLSTQYENFKWMMPTFIDAFDFLGDDWAVEMSITPRDMTRIINVKSALELMRYPDGQGEYVIEVLNDNTIPANNGKYLIEYGPQGSKVSTTTKDADIRCSILSLSQLVTGYRTLENALYSRRDDLEVCSNIKTLKNVFTLRPQHVTEYF
jgi:predicted acetyltransferase